MIVKYNPNTFSIQFDTHLPALRMFTPAESPVEKPAPCPECTPQQILSGPPVEPLDRIKNYSEAQFEAFIAEWAYYYLKELSGEYESVARTGGAGDKGRDVIGYVNKKPSIVYDVFQCKHYDAALAPSDIWIELAKLCHHTYTGVLAMPRKYRFVSPKDVGPKLGLLLEKPDELKAGLIKAWQNTTAADPICKRLVAGATVLLDAHLLNHVEAFDFSVVGYKSMEEVVSEHRKTIRHAPRFGGGLVKSCPPDKSPPATPQPDEAVYVEALLAAYRDNLQDNTLDLTTLVKHGRLNQHFVRSRERFYCAETLREFAKDALPDGTTFEAVQDQIYEAIIDIVESDFPCGYSRVKEATKTASLLRVTNHILGSYLKSKSLQGICHQLANAARVEWVRND
jgi:hypothetical protein